MINSSDSLLYNLSYLSSVIHPVIILRLLEHRLFTPLFKKKSVTSNPPVSTPLPVNDDKPVNVSLAPKIAAVALVSAIPTLPKPDPFKRQRNSLRKDNPSANPDRSSLLTKFTHSTYDKHRKPSKATPLSTSTSGITSMNSQMPTNNNNLLAAATSASTAAGANATDLSLLLSFTSPLTSTSSSSTLTGNNPTQPVTTTTTTTTATRKWFWRNSEKNNQTNPSNDRNLLLQAIVEADTSTSTSHSPSTSTTTGNAAGVGEIKLLEKELLNLPTFQLSDSQNPLLPSPTYLNYDFPAQFDPSSPTINLDISRQHSASSSSSHLKGGAQPNAISNTLFKSRANNDYADDDDDGT